MDKREIYSTSHGTYHSTQSSKSILSSNSSSSTWPVISLEESPNSECCQQLQQLNKDVDSTTEFVCGVNDIVCASIPANVTLVVLGCFAIIELSLGVRYLSDCPVQPKIPVFLFVGGCFALLKVVHLLWTNFRMRNYSNFVSENGSNKSQSAVQIVDGVLNIFLVVWQILGTYWAMSVWYPHWEPPLHEPNSWCEYGVYMFTLVQLSLAVLIVLGRVLFHGSLACCHKYTHLFEA